MCLSVLRGGTSLLPRKAPVFVQRRDFSVADIKKFKESTVGAKTYYQISPCNEISSELAALLCNAKVHRQSFPKALTPGSSLPSKLLGKQPFSALPSFVEKRIQHVAQYEKNRIKYFVEKHPESRRAQLVKHHFRAVNEALLLQYKDKQQVFPCLEWDEIASAAVWTKRGSWFQVTGRVDSGLFGEYSLASPIDSHPPVSAEFSEAVWKELYQRLHQTNHPDRDPSTFFPQQFQESPLFLTPFIVHPMTHSCMNFVMENKVELTDYAIGQAMLYSANSLVSFACYSLQKGPSISISVISNGTSYIFQIFQLNTLNFENDSQFKNEVWISPLMPVFNGEKVNSQPFAYLYHLLQYVYAYQRHCMLQKKPQLN